MLAWTWYRWLLVLVACWIAAPVYAKPSDEVHRLLNAGSTPESIEGLPATYGMEGAQRNSRGYGVLRVKITPPPFRILIWPREPDAKPSAIAIKTDDAAFDAAFSVEGAPSDFVLTVLDADLRKALLAAPRVIVGVDGSQWATVSVGHGVDTDAEAQGVVNVATLVVRHIRDGVEPPPGMALTPEERTKQLAEWERVRKSRGPDIFFMVMMGLVGLAVIGGLAYNISNRRPRPQRPYR